MPTMFFKGRFKALRIYLVKVMVLAIDMNDRNFIAIESFELYITIDINHLNGKCEFFSQTFEGHNRILAKVAAVAGVDGDHDAILAS
jgi:hypothetical protein